MMIRKAATSFCSVSKINRVGPAILFFLLLTGTAWPQTEHLSIRGHQQILHLYGKRGDPPVIVSSGDGGWVHLGPQVAEFLSKKGFFVVGFDTKEYLESFTSGKDGVRVEDEPGDYRVLADYAAQGSSRKPILIGVSEGAGLSVLAATDAGMQRAIAGVIGLGLPDMNELAWHLRDAVIYVTHAVPKEPLFSTKSIAGKVSPVPLAVIHSTHDEFVSLDEVNSVFSAAKQPKKLWIIQASNHRFSDNLEEFDKRLLEAIEWLGQNQP